jgi:GNAT superfamily N-acetyltransferase
VIRKATRDDLPAIVDAMAHAFYDDPVFRWLFPDDDRRLAQSRKYFGGRARALARQDEIYTVDGGKAAAMWARPGEWQDPPLEVARQFAALVPALWKRAGRSLAGLHAIESRHPSEPHWYLSVLGAHPDCQGEGFGSALLQPILAECDRLEIPAYLETGKERNVDFYTRQGFAVTEQIDLPDGPPMWLMWRDPR